MPPIRRADRPTAREARAALADRMPDGTWLVAEASTSHVVTMAARIRSASGSLS